MSRKGSTRNVSCPCGSGKKFKVCHGRDRTQRSASLLLVGGGLLLVLAVLVIMASSGLRSGGGEQPKGSMRRTTLYTSIPGLQLQLLSSAEQGQLLTNLNNTPCTCDCDMTVAECRHLDPDCQHSKELAEVSFSQLVSRDRQLPSSPMKSAH